MSKKNRAIRSSRPLRDNAAVDLATAQPKQPPAIDADHPAQSSASPKWRNAYLLIPVAIAILASINTLWNDFASDDLLQIIRNSLIKDLSNLPLAFTTSVWSYATEDIIIATDSYYRPLFMALFTLNHALFGTTAWGWHLINVLIHAGVTLLLFITFREATSRPWTAAIASTLFAVHPAHAESIAWLSGITDPLMALFLLPAFYFYLRYRKTGRSVTIALALVFYLLALLCKETALALPLVIAYCEAFYFKDENPLTRRVIRALALASLFILPTAIYFALRYFALSSIFFGSGQRYPLGPSLATVPLAIVKYLGLMSIPSGYSYQHYTDLVIAITQARFWLPLILIVIITTGIILSRSRILGFAAIWFIVTLAPALAVLPRFDPEYLIQERYLYIPSMGFCLAVACAIEWIASRSVLGLRSNAVAAALTVILVVVWGAAYFKHNAAWNNTVSIFERCVEVEPQSPPAHAALAKAYFETGRSRQAEEQAQAALDLNEGDANSYLNLSYFAHFSGMLDKAIEYLERGTSAVEDSPMTRYKRATMYLNLGLLYTQRKDFDKAEDSLKRSIEIWPRPTGWYYAGQFYLERGRYAEAREMLELTRDNVPPKYAPIYFRLGQVYEKLNQRPQARAAYERYLRFALPISRDRDEALRRLQNL